jgi:hypothetical protein
LGEASEDDGFKFGVGVESAEVGVVGMIVLGQEGEPSTPDTRFVVLDLWHGFLVSGKLCKMQDIQEVISSGRGLIRKPFGICEGK